MEKTGFLILILSLALALGAPGSAEESKAPDQDAASPDKTQIAAAGHPDFGDPFEEMLAMRRLMRRMMHDRFFSDPFFAAPQAEGLINFSPSMDVSETDKSFVVTCDLPGMDKDKIGIEVRDNLLILSGERKAAREDKGDGSNYHFREVSYGSFSRTLVLPDYVDKQKITADYENGVLKIQMPKTQKTEKKIKIDVK